MCRTTAFTLLFFLALGGGVAEGTIPANSKRKLDLPVEEWLKATHHQDFPLELRIAPPQLTFEQRQLVRIIGRIDLRILQQKQIHRELHFIVKVAGAHGDWYAGESYATTSFTEKIKTAADLQLVSEIYFAPGDYTVAVIVYDAASQERTLARQQLRIAAIQNDPLPYLEEDLPPVEFLPEAESGTVPLGVDGRQLPLRSRTPLLIDLVVEFGSSKLHAGALIQAASLLSRISPTRGCVVVSGLDVLRLEVLFRRNNAAQMRWPDLRQEVLARNLSTIDATVLAARQRSVTAFGTFLHSVMAAPPACDVEGAKRVIIILSDGVEFPRGAPVPPLEPRPDCSCPIYYFRQMLWHRNDDMPRLLKRLDSRTKDIRDPRQFRKRLAELISNLEAPGRPESKAIKLQP